MEAHFNPLQAQQKLDDTRPPTLATGKRIRRRARDVSSRYMVTASPSSTPSSPIHQSSTSPCFRNYRPRNPKPRIPSLSSSPDTTDSDSEHSSLYADENHRSLDTPLPLRVYCKDPNTLKRRVVRLFSDNADDTPQTQIVERHKCVTDSRFSQCRPRVGVPRPAICGQKLLRPTKKAATNEGTDGCSISSHGGQCHSPPIHSQGRKQSSDLRSSMPEADSLLASSRKQAGGEQLTFRRSLNSALSDCKPNPFNILKVVNSKNSVDEICNLGRIVFPPQLVDSRLGLDLRKDKKGSSRREDAHGYYILHNQYLQWRFANAKSKRANKARVIMAERSLSDVSEKLEGLRSSVIEKRMELERLKGLKKISNIIDLQTPYLEEWALVDGESSASVSGVIKALQDASIRLPVIGDVRVDIRELKVAIHSVTRVFDSFSPSIGRFLPMIDEIEKIVTELSKVANWEKSLVEECGSLISQLQGLQIKECSMRIMLMQVQRSGII